MNRPLPHSDLRFSRRRFLAASGAALGGSLTILPGGVLRGQGPRPSERLRVGAIGVGGQMQGHVARLLQLGHEVPALCDVDDAQIDATRKRHGDALAKAGSFRDYRKLFDQEGASLDAVVIATPDHWHAPICRAAIAAGKHVYCEKPLTHTIGEARDLRELSKAEKVVTQTGNQGSASGNLRRSMELIAAGFFGPIREIHVWHPEHSWPSGVDRPDGADPVPTGLDWDFWIGPAPSRPYKSDIYHPAKWRGWYDFGNGSLGDFCCHGFNMPVRALDLDYPTRIEVSGDGLGRESFATSCTVRYHFPQRGERAPVQLVFYSGRDQPPEDLTADLRKSFGGLPRTGCLLVGDKGQLQSGLWNSDCYIKLDGEEKFFGADNHPEAKKVPQHLPRVAGHLDEWVDACLGGPRAFADFDHGGHLTEIGLAGIVALRLGQSIDWDGPGMKVPDMPGADRFIRKQDRTEFL